MRLATKTLIALATACATAPPDPPAPPEPHHNVLVFLIDDVGIDRLASYGATASVPHTPVIDGLAATGVRFSRAYATPLCSPSRAALLTGRHGRRTGIGGLVQPDGQRSLDELDYTLPRLFHESERGYTTSLVGKWHLATEADDAPTHPGRAGFDWYAGSLYNPRVSLSDRLEPANYDSWEKNTNGRLAWTDLYATIDTIRDAQTRVVPELEPWFTLVSFNGAHVPLHRPPAALTYSTRLPDASNAEVHAAMIESIDIAIGSVLSRLTPAVRARTTVIVISDNGTPESLVPDGSDPLRAKGTIFEGGSRIAFIIDSPLVTSPGATTDALTHIVDVYPTVAELVGVTPSGPALDGHSLLPWLADPTLPGRETVYTELFQPNGPMPEATSARAVYDGTYKLTRTTLPQSLPIESLYLLDDPTTLDEGPDLLDDDAPPLSDDAAAALARLRRALDAHFLDLISE